jgi:hypothetical protein
MTGQNEYFWWALFAVSWGSRVRGVFRRLKQPRLRGEGWFFDVPVRSGFYAGAGRGLERAYRARMAAPVVLEVAFWVWALATGHVTWLLWAVIVAGVVVHVNHWFNVQVAEHAARAYAVVEETRPVAAVGLSLTPRRLRDSTNGWVEGGVWAATLVGFGWLGRVYAGGGISARDVFGLPVVFVYLQLGFLLAKEVIVSWRSPVPMAQTAEYVEARGAMRRYYLWTCDSNRIALTLGICLYALRLSFPATYHARVMQGWEGLWLALCVVMVIWTEVKRSSWRRWGRR